MQHDEPDDGGRCRQQAQQERERGARQSSHRELVGDIRDDRRADPHAGSQISQVGCAKAVAASAIPTGVTTTAATTIATASWSMPESPGVPSLAEPLVATRCPSIT
ncbi:hypothetical protein [Flexivirga alba]|uniref:Uncharacterized protein n=1 Tax=Flexivirga alba TaxID=702742 RepID=A0ABW2ADY3_9MICO